MFTHTAYTTTTTVVVRQAIQFESHCNWNHHNENNQCMYVLNTAVGCAVHCTSTTVYSALYLLAYYFRDCSKTIVN